MLQQFRESAIGKIAAIAILSLIAVTFIFFGNFDFGFTGTTFAAKVNGEEIPVTEFERELQQYQNQYQQALRIELNDDLRREMRRLVVDQMVLTEALEQQTEAVGYRISDERVAEAIQSTEAFQAGGEFSVDAYVARLNNEGLTPSLYEALVRDQLALLEIQTGIEASAFLTPAEYRRYIELYNERREIAYATFAVEDFLAQADVTDEEVAEYYEANSGEFLTDETVDIEYVELTLAGIADEIEITEQDLRDYYADQQERFAQAEERRVRHILIDVEEDDYEAAEARAEAVLERLDAGEDFAALAEELSGDAGTRTQGGDLGWVGRGLLAGPFEDTLFAMEVGETAGPVETEFGYHILRLDEIRSGDVQPFEAVRDELHEELSTESAQQQFYDLANELDLKAFEARNTLAGVAEEMGLPLEVLEGFSRVGDPAVFPNSEPVVMAVFDEDTIFSEENTGLIELADDHVVVARVTAHHPPEQQMLDAVAEEIRGVLSQGEAQSLVGEAAAAFLAELEAGVEGAAGSAADADAGDEPGDASADTDARADEEAGDGSEAGEAGGLAAAAERHGGQWTASRFVERSDAQVPREVLSAAFNQPKPTEGEVFRRLVPLASGDEAVLILSAVETGRPDAVSQAQRDQRQRELADQSARIEINSYAGTVRDRATVRIPDAILNPQF